MNLVEELIGVIDALQEAGMEYAICGGLAVGSRTMSELPSANIPPAEVERRLRDLAQICELWAALRDVRFIEPTNRNEVRERPDADEFNCS